MSSGKKERQCFYFQLILKDKLWSRVKPETRESNGTPLQYSCLENPMDGGAW